MCGSFNEEEELDYEEHLQDENSDQEEGEVISDESEDEQWEEDLEVNRCVKSGNLEKLKKILKRREEDCKKLEKEVQKEKNKKKQELEIRKVLEKNQQGQQNKEISPKITGNFQAIFTDRQP